MLTKRGLNWLLLLRTSWGAEEWFFLDFGCWPPTRIITFGCWTFNRIKDCDGLGAGGLSYCSHDRNYTSCTKWKQSFLTFSFRDKCVIFHGACSKAPIGHQSAQHQKCTCRRLMKGQRKVQGEAMHLASSKKHCYVLRSCFDDSAESLSYLT